MQSTCRPVIPAVSCEVRFLTGSILHFQEKSGMWPPLRLTFGLAGGWEMWFMKSQVSLSLYVSKPTALKQTSQFQVILLVMPELGLYLSIAIPNHSQIFYSLIVERRLARRPGAPCVALSILPWLALARPSHPPFPKTIFNDFLP
jgi:hypothetical protein